MKKVLITGANFNNKGAQAMLFVTASEILTRYPDASIYYTTREALVPRKGFKLIALNKHAFLNAFAIKSSDTNAYKGFLAASLHSFKSLVKRDFRAIYSDYRYLQLIDTLDLILDVSGFNLSSLFSVKTNNYYLKFIDCAQKCNIPVILLPQSFGPFDYAENNSQYISRMSEILQYPKLIFAREKAAYDILTQNLNLQNVVLSNDLVLQNKGIDLTSIFEPGSLPTYNITITTKNNTAIIPNKKIIDKCPHINIFQLYNDMITTFLNRGRTIYLIYHSSEDYHICKKIKADFASVESVILLPQELNCYDYENVITHFDYVVTSRFHSIVHAFKQNIPCLGLGWAEKYRELFSALSQSQYLLDMRKAIPHAQVMERLTKLEQNWQAEKIVIKKHLTIIQSNNCFNMVFNELEKQGI